MATLPSQCGLQTQWLSLQTLLPYNRKAQLLRQGPAALAKLADRLDLRQTVIKCDQTTPLRHSAVAWQLNSVPKTRRCDWRRTRKRFEATNILEDALHYFLEVPGVNQS